LKDSDSPRLVRLGSLRGERAFRILVVIAALVLAVLTGLFFFELVIGSLQPLERIGFGFILGSRWDPLREVFGVLPMIYGSLLTALVALTIGVPVSLGVAIFLSELSPSRLRLPLSFVVELLAAVPSVVYGIWGLFILAPFLRVSVYPALQQYLGFLPIFQGTPFAGGVLTAGVILAVMIVPIVASISRDALRAVPDTQREAAYALGATKSEVISTSVLSYARSGLIAAVFLGFGRAFGETMAVTMVIGLSPTISVSLFSPAQTLASLVASEFTEATTDFYISALVEAGLILLVISFLTNVLARALIRRLVRGVEAAQYQ
jgi:phosphate transport system permease protein